MLSLQKTKITVYIALPVVILSVLYICLTKTIIFSDKNATLTFIYDGTNIVQTLTDEETEKVKAILSAKNPEYFLLPSDRFFPCN